MDTHEQTPQQSITLPAAQHSHIFPLLLIGLVLFLTGLGSGYFLFGNKGTVSQIANQGRQIEPTYDPFVSPTIQVTLLNERANWIEFNNQYFRIRHPKSWRLVDEPNKGTNDIALIYLMQSELENDGSSLLNSYAIHIISNNTGKDAMSFAKSDIVSNWQPDNEPTYEAYKLNNLDAVIVKNLSAGKGPWGPSVYIVNKAFAVQIISDDPLENPDKYFYPVVNTFSFMYSK